MHYIPFVQLINMYKLGVIYTVIEIQFLTYTTSLRGFAALRAADAHRGFFGGPLEISGSEG
jgi:hypothetical protein